MLVLELSGGPCDGKRTPFPLLISCCGNENTDGRGNKNSRIMKTRSLYIGLRATSDVSPSSLV